MNPLFKEIAACPGCRSQSVERSGASLQALEWAADGVLCLACGRRYRLAGDVPLLMLDAAGQPLIEPPLAGLIAQRPAQNWRQRLSRSTAVPGFSYKTPASRQRIPRFVASLGPQAILLNIGSGRTSFGPRVVNLDLGPFPGVDAVAGGEALPAAGHCVDGVITQGVLEHVPDLSRVLAEIDRVLKPGGMVYHEVPFIQGYHGSPGDFRRFTLQGVAGLVPGYQIVERGVAVGPSSAVGWLLSEWLALLFSFGHPGLHKAGRRAFGWLLSPLKFFDRWLEGRAEAGLVACALYVVGRKPACD